MRRLVIAFATAALFPAAAHAQTKVVIDPGHGGRDPGGTGNGLQEKNIVLDVSKRFGDLMNADTTDDAGGGSWAVSMTRTDDTFVSLSGRAAYANNRGADRFISIHSNAFDDPSANGTETFSYSSGTTSAQLRNLVQEELLKAWGFRDRGAKTANFAVLRETAMPAILTELAFITNATEAEKLGSPEERQKIAEAHLFGLQRHYDQAPYVPGEATGDPGNGDFGEGAGSIAGRLVDADGPVADAVVVLDDELEATSGEDGRFAFTDLEPGAHSLTVVVSTHHPTTAEVEVATGQAAEFEIELVPLKQGDNLDGGCHSGGGSTPLGSALALLALIGLARRRSKRAEL